MTRRENYLSLVRRQGYERIPYSFSMCPSLSARYNEYCARTGFKAEFCETYIPAIAPRRVEHERYKQYYTGINFKPGTVIDDTGVAHEPGSEAAFHMTRMYHPMENFDSVDQVLDYPFLEYAGADETPLREAVAAAREADLIAVGSMQCTIWETAWYLRSMESLMMDMLSDERMAAAVLDKVTQTAVLRACAYARAGVDVLFLGDDIGMQRSVMMSENMYCEWLKPRLKAVIAAAKAIKPDLIVFYHSCGYVLPFIGHLIDAGVDVLNPVQPECMDFAEVHARYGDRLSFHGTIGTQTTMPFGTPDEVRRVVFTNLDIAGAKGGLLPAPTHLLEPEVPVENVIAYIKACEDYAH